VCTVRKTRMDIFKKNVISFPQDTAKFFATMGAMKQFRVQDRVHSNRPPGSDPLNVNRAPMLWSDAGPEWQTQYVQDARGYVIFPATVTRVDPDGRLFLKYDAGLGEGLECRDQVTPRVQMPWHPKALRDNLVIMLRKNVGYGRVLEGLEVRWPLVVRVMHALTSCPGIGESAWRDGGAMDEPMHRAYDPRLFDCLSEAEVLQAYAPKLYRGEYVDGERASELIQQGEVVEPQKECTRAMDLVAMGFDVRAVGAIGEEGDECEERLGVDIVPKHVFARWLELRECRFGSQLAEWFSSQRAGDEEDVLAIKKHDDETCIDFWNRIVEDVKEDPTLLVSGVSVTAALTGTDLTIASLLAWCRRRVADDFALDFEDQTAEEAMDTLRFELRVVADFFEADESSGVVEDALVTRDGACSERCVWLARSGGGSN
jgi:hypothetical protein